MAIFNPGKNTNQVSRLRLINPGAERTEVRIEGIDDEGQSPGEAVVLSLDGGASRTLSAKELEAGTGVSGGLGTGKGKWRLVVSADAPIEVLNTLSTPTGHLTNISTVPEYAESDDDGTHRIGLFPSAADAQGRQGFARIINHSDSDGEVDIDAYDDDGKHYGPLMLAIDAGETVHFNSDDLETGNAGKGLEGSTGPPDKGNWRLELSSTLELQVLSYIRTSDGFLTSMHDFVARTGAGQHRVAIFNPGKNTNQVSRLRLINPGTESTEVRIEGIDDKGQSPGEAVVLSLDGGASRTLSAKELEAGTGVSGGLGDGQGQVAAGGQRRRAHRGAEHALHPDRAPDQSLHRAGAGGVRRDRGGCVPRTHLGTHRARQVHRLPRRGRGVGAHAAGVRALVATRP